MTQGEQRKVNEHAKAEWQTMGAEEKHALGVLYRQRVRRRVQGSVGAVADPSDVVAAVGPEALVPAIGAGTIVGDFGVGTSKLPLNPARFCQPPPNSPLGPAASHPGPPLHPPTLCSIGRKRRETHPLAWTLFHRRGGM